MPLAILTAIATLCLGQPSGCRLHLRACLSQHLVDDMDQAISCFHDWHPPLQDYPCQIPREPEQLLADCVDENGL
jgi:hypothetical protein